MSLGEGAELSEKSQDLAEERICGFVEQLLWEVEGAEYNEPGYPFATCIFGHYVIHPYYGHVELMIGHGRPSQVSLGRIALGRDAKLEELKAAAQADYARRIRPAIRQDPLPAISAPQTETAARESVDLIDRAEVLAKIDACRLGIRPFSNTKYGEALREGAEMALRLLPPVIKGIKSV